MNVKVCEFSEAILRGINESHEPDGNQRAVTESFVVLTSVITAAYDIVIFKRKPRYGKSSRSSGGQIKLLVIS